MKAYITVVGKDKIGIIASVSKLLSDNLINIEDLSQTILQGMFTMIMAVDISAAQKPLDEIAVLLAEEGKRLGMEITIRHADIFNAMHRI
ncbi:MAG TPA: ACT domain-containing protein [Candidatus Stercoripulliclostridium merdipullorum]|uniref:UPF0237 protein IAB14_01115 n=1 Tax=Candidatus Stercoripulliclostridium merdipullorum TaxID=2840952 RepID=A0A9D1SXB8_9FIRM|nr:ACT domain-containing protein [Candidatus Stercoripulliclostridium merdipullorum]